MRKFSLIAAALVVSIGAYSTNAHAFRLTSGNFKSEPLNKQCYYGKATLTYAGAHAQAGQTAHSLSAADNTYQGCNARLINDLNYQHTTFGHQYSITHPCALYTSCPVGQALLIEAPDTSGVDTDDILRLREEFRIDEFERRLLQMLGRRPAAD